MVVYAFFSFQPSVFVSAFIYYTTLDDHGPCLLVLALPFIALLHCVTEKERQTKEQG